MFIQTNKLPEIHPYRKNTEAEKIFGLQTYLNHADMKTYVLMLSRTNLPWFRLDHFRPVDGLRGIVKLFEVFEDQKSVYMVMDWNFWESWQSFSNVEHVSFWNVKRSLWWIFGHVDTAYMFDYRYMYLYQFISVWLKRTRWVDPCFFPNMCFPVWLFGKLVCQWNDNQSMNFCACSPCLDVHGSRV